ncbi:MAG TPA: BlaI/MecI/CopY family transcriptional regulator [Chthonomonadaceae bacterium]|nr:BlaI/MecI/CopY family transcriptional regulator [Chthonomonadaceae bacterium]
MGPTTGPISDPLNADAMHRRRKYIGVGGDDVPSLGVLEGEILRLLWDAGEPQSSVQVYEAMHIARRAEEREMQSPSTIAVTLSRMVEKGLLSVERRPKGGKGYYAPTRPRSEVVASVMDDVSRRLTGVPLGNLLSMLPARTGRPGSKDAAAPALGELVDELRRLQRGEGYQ